MDLFSLTFALIIAFISVCIVIMLIADSDVRTFMYERYGPDPKKYFENKVVWVTGASSGIGEAIAKELAKCDNVKIVLSARRKEELERVKKECLAINRNIKSDSILILQLDMLEYSSHEPAFEKVLTTFGKLDLLISNAGISQRAKWEEIETAIDKQIFELNVFSLINLTRIVLRHFIKIGKGHFAVTSSMVGKFGVPNTSSYCASKYAIQGFYESLGNEMRNLDMPVTILCPGPVASQISEAAVSAKVGVAHGVSDHGITRMSPERCAQLCMVALANKLDESWISTLPFVPLVYLRSYQPYIFSKVKRIMMNMNKNPSDK